MVRRRPPRSTATGIRTGLTPSPEGWQGGQGVLVPDATRRDTRSTMSRQNVEVVCAIYRAFSRRDRDALVPHLDPCIRIYDRPFHPDASVYEGTEGFLRFSQTDWEAFDEVAYEPQDFVANGPTSSSRSSKAGEARAARSVSRSALSTSGNCGEGSVSSCASSPRSRRLSRLRGNRPRSLCHPR
jgi:SnoaL-like protein